MYEFVCLFVVLSLDFLALESFEENMEEITHFYFVLVCVGCFCCLDECCLLD